MSIKDTFDLEIDDDIDESMEDEGYSAKVRRAVGDGGGKKGATKKGAKEEVPVSVDKTNAKKGLKTALILMLVVLVVCVLVYRFAGAIAANKAAAGYSVPAVQQSAEQSAPLAERDNRELIESNTDSDSWVRIGGLQGTISNKITNDFTVKTIEFRAKVINENTAVQVRCFAVGNIAGKADLYEVEIPSTYAVQLKEGHKFRVTYYEVEGGIVLDLKA